MAIMVPFGCLFKKGNKTNEVVMLVEDQQFSKLNNDGNVFQWSISKAVPFKKRAKTSLEIHKTA